MAGLPCAKVLIDKKYEIELRTNCIGGIADIFRDILPEDKTNEALKHMTAAEESLAKAQAILNGAVPTMTTR